MTITKRAMDIIKEREGFRSAAYLDPVGIWTIGYGTTAMAGVGITPKAGMVISEPEATMYLERAVDKFADAIRPKITRPVNANQFGAMVSLAYNIGPGAFNSSTLLRKFNAGDVKGASEQFLVWDKAGGKVLRGLQIRRQQEKALFDTPIGLSPRPVPQTSGGFWANLIAAIFGRK